MAELTTLVRPYAKAAFEFALQDNSLSEWSDMLNLMATAARDPEMERALHHPSLTDEEKASAFLDVCDSKLSETGKNFVRILAENKRLTLLPEIAERFEALKAEQERAIDVELTSAFELTAEQEGKLSQALERKLNRQVRLSSATDKSLMGGVIVRAGDMVIDASVRGKLRKLADAIGS